MDKEYKNILTLIVFAVIIIATVAFLYEAYSDPCSRPIIDCQQLQPTVTK